MLVVTHWNRDEDFLQPDIFQPWSNQRHKTSFCKIKKLMGWRNKHTTTFCGGPRHSRKLIWWVGKNQENRSMWWGCKKIRVRLIKPTFDIKKRNLMWGIQNKKRKIIMNMKKSIFVIPIPRKFLIRKWLILWPLIASF